MRRLHIAVLVSGRELDLTHARVDRRPDGNLLDRVELDERLLVRGLDGAGSLVRFRAERLADDGRDDRVLRDGEEWIDFHGPPGWIPTISFSEAGNQPADFYADRIVIVGATAPTLKDLHATSTSGDGFMSGPKLEAHAISTALRGFPLRSAARPVDILLVLAPALLARSLGLRSLIPTVALIALGYLVAAQMAFNEGVISPVLYPLVALGLSTVGVVGVNAIASGLEQERARALFARFVPRESLDDVLAEAGDDLRLAGTELDGTALFIDLRSFTEFVDAHEPEEVMSVLNRYLETVSRAVYEHGGTVVSYQGDGVLAVFGAPLVQTDHAARALVPEACRSSIAGSLAAR